MSDIGLPDFGGQDLGIDLEKGIFVRKGKKSDNDSNDSGNNSMNTNGSGTYCNNYNYSKDSIIRTVSIKRTVWKFYHKRTVYVGCVDCSPTLEL